jgi:8-oxo-dGTP diphosphatase
MLPMMANENPFRLVPDVSLLLLKDNHVYLVLRSNTGYQDGMYGLPAGHKDQGETARVGACREAHEEVGVIVDPDHLQCVSVVHRRDHDERVSFFFLATEWQGEPFNKEPEKHESAGWFALEALPENTMPFMRHGLEAYKRGAFYSEMGW